MDPKKIILSTVALSDKQSETVELASGDFQIEFSKDGQSVNAERVEVLLLSDNASLQRETLSRLPNLKLIQTLWAGVDSVKFEIIPDSVTVCGNVGGFSQPIAEHVFGMIVSLAKDFREHERDLREGRFDRTKQGIFLNGKTICILGTGGIGQAVARLAKAFGMTTLGVNTKGEAAPEFDRTAAVSQLDEFLRQAQFVVIALPLTNKTRNLFDAKRLSRLNPGTILVNVGRAKVIDQKALYEYLVANPKVKVGTDVWWSYPKRGQKFAQDFAFFDLPNFMGTPHNSNDVPEADQIALDNAVKNILRYVNGEPLRGVAKREDYMKHED
jgi:phosphoglycerate dehydrogenase-like enzyme